MSTLRKKYVYLVWSIALLVLGVVLGVGVERLLLAQQASLQREVLLTRDVPGAKSHELVMVKVGMASESRGGKHFHPGVEVGYVLDGSAILEVEGQPPLEIKAGDAFQINDEINHDVMTKSETYSGISIYIVEKGQPLATPIP